MQKARCKKLICQNADNQKGDLSKSQYFAPPIPLKQKADMQKPAFCMDKVP
jgi:hypothetical protein